VATVREVDENVLVSQSAGQFEVGIGDGARRIGIRDETSTDVGRER
jgi:hypothetical protein